MKNLNIEQFAIVALIIAVVIPGGSLIWLFLYLSKKWRDTAEKTRLEDEEKLKVLSQQYSGQPVFLCDSIYQVTDPSPESVTELVGNVISSIDYMAQTGHSLESDLEFYDGYEISGMPTVPIRPGMQLTIQDKQCLIRQIHFTEDNLDGTDSQGPVGKQYPIIIQAPGIDLKTLEQQVNQNPDTPAVLPIDITIMTPEAFEDANLPN